MTFKGPIQPKLFYDFMKHWEGHPGSLCTPFERQSLGGYLPSGTVCLEPEITVDIIAGVSLAIYD